MKVRKIDKSQFKESVWSGGSTSQLYIYPEDADLNEKSFDFRISSAIIDVEESDFTAFPGFSRMLMVLDGELEIIHKDQYS